MYSSLNEKQCIDKFTKESTPNVRNRYKNICKILNNIQITDDIQIINKAFTDMLYLWFNDNAILHEIYKHLQSNGICVLHEIVIWYNVGNTGQTMYIIPHNYGYDDMSETTKTHTTSYLDFERYYVTQIKKCKNNIMAIPITIYYNNDTNAHSNMLIIKRQLNLPIKILVEHFEPYGNMSLLDNAFEISHLINNLFAYEINNQNEIQIISSTKYNCPIQIQLMGTKYSDTCSILSLWYAIKRLLNPEEDPYETYRNISNYLKNNGAELAIKNVIKSFMLLIDISEKGIINGKKSINKNILEHVTDKKTTGGHKKKFTRRKCIKKITKCRKSKASR